MELAFYAAALVAVYSTLRVISTSNPMHALLNLIISLIAVSPTAALIVGVTMLVYMQIEAYVITPRIMSRAIEVPGAVVVVAALAGGALSA